MITPDGTSVVFVTDATDLVAPISDSYSTPDVFVRDLVTGTTTLLSVNADGISTKGAPRRRRER